MENGAHENQTYNGFLPQGWAYLPDSLILPQTFPVVDLTIENETVVAIKSNPSAYENAQAENVKILTDIERITSLEEENKLLKAQVQAQSDQLDFYEECIAEMAEVVYA